MNKVTKEQRNLDIINLLMGEPAEFGTTIEEAINHLEHENELLTKRVHSSKKMSTADKMLMEEVFNALPEATEPKKTISEIIKSVDALNDFSTQKITPIMSKLAKANRAVKIIEKGRSYYCKA